MVKTLAVLTASILLSTFISASELIVKYEGFRLYIDCTQTGVTHFYYKLKKDKGQASRPSGFRKDPNVTEAGCQPSNGESYTWNRLSTLADYEEYSFPLDESYQRGHLVPANHMDESDFRIYQTNYVTNVLPQDETFNEEGGAWRELEDLAECYRDKTDLKIWGGVVWGDDSTNDHFLFSHQVKTPDFWWKLIYRKDTKEYMAFIWPNDSTATWESTDSSDLRSVDELREYIGEIKLRYFPLRARKAEAIWSGNFSGTTLTCEDTTTSLE